MEFRNKRSHFWRLIDAYAAARQQVIASGFLAEIAWQQSRDIQVVTETEFGPIRLGCSRRRLSRLRRPSEVSGSSLCVPRFLVGT